MQTILRIRRIIATGLYRLRLIQRTTMFRIEVDESLGEWS
jgi:hypothetical protein